MTSLHDYDGLWNKSLLFMNRAFAATDEGRTFEEAALWASFALELLGKSALAKINPALIAVPNDDGKSILIACGLAGDTAEFRSIQAKTVFSRCSRAFPPFNAREGLLVAANRNEYLHSAAVSFSPLPATVWWQRFWTQVVLLLSAQDRSLLDFAGEDRVEDIEIQLAADRDSRRQRIEALFSRARLRLELQKDGNISARLAAEFAAPLSRISDFERREFIECPVCGQDGFLLGDYGERGEIHYEPDIEFVWQDMVVSSDAFMCQNCGLILEGVDFVAEGGLPESFDVEADPDFGWDEYGND